MVFEILNENTSQYVDITPYIAHGGIKWSRNDVDGPNAGRMQNGEMIDSVKTDNFYNGVFVFRNVAQGDYTLKVVHSDYYSLEMPIQVVKGEITYQDMMLNKQRPDRPVVQSYVPSSSEEVDLFAPIRIDFSVDMLADSVIKAFSISPAVEGNLYLVNSQRTLVFEPENGYEVGTQYAVKISTSAISARA